MTKSYPTAERSRPVLEQVSLQARAGELTAIVGPSGSGKTTLLRIAAGLTRPDSGVVTLQQTRLYDQEDATLSRIRNDQIGFIFQDYRLLPSYNAIENVMLPMMIAGLSRRRRQQRARDALSTVGLGAKARQRVDTLSGGQQQRVGIARALAMRPSVLIADEPTGNLDTARGADILELFLQLRAQRGISVVLVTHNDAVAARADHVVTLVDGRVQEDSHAAA